MRSWLCRIVLLALLIGIQSCASSQPLSLGAPGTDVSGVWTGTSKVTPPCTGSRCEAINNITLQLNQQGTDVSGGYTCANGTRVCRHEGADDSGKISQGTITGDHLTLNIQITADLSNCYFDGTAISGKLSGVYRCYNGAALVEEGVFEVTRPFPQS